MQTNINDKLVKTRIISHYHAHCFSLDIMVTYLMKLNLNKCVFRVESSKFLRYIGSQHGKMLTLLKQ